MSALTRSRGWTGLPFSTSSWCLLPKWIVIHLSLQLLSFSANSLLALSLLVLFLDLNLLVPQIKILRLTILLLVFRSKVQITTTWQRLLSFMLWLIIRRIPVPSSTIVPLASIVLHP